MIIRGKYGEGGGGLMNECVGYCQLVPPENEDLIFLGGGGGVSSKFYCPLLKIQGPPVPPTGNMVDMVVDGTGEG